MPGADVRPGIVRERNRLGAAHGPVGAHELGRALWRLPHEIAGVASDDDNAVQAAVAHPAEEEGAGHRTVGTPELDVVVRLRHGVKERAVRQRVEPPVGTRDALPAAFGRQAESWVPPPCRRSPRARCRRRPGDGEEGCPAPAQHADTGASGQGQIAHEPFPLPCRRIPGFRTVHPIVGYEEGDPGTRKLRGADGQPRPEVGDEAGPLPCRRSPRAHLVHPSWPAKKSVEPSTASAPRRWRGATAPGRDRAPSMPTPCVGRQSRHARRRREEVRRAHRDRRARSR